MGIRDWWNSAKKFGENLWQYKTVQEPAMAAASFSYRTITHLFEQVGVIPGVIASFAKSGATQTIGKHMLRLVVTDLIPLVLVTYCNDTLQRYGRTYLDDETLEDDKICIKFSIDALLCLLKTATFIYSTRQSAQLITHTVVISLETPRLNEGREPIKICHDEHCTALRFLQGNVRDLATYLATELAIWSINFIPMPGSGALATSLSVYHRGRYVLSVVLPDMCNRHQMIYLSNNPELSLSLGLAHVAMTYYMNEMLEKQTGIPSLFFEATIHQLLLIIQMSIAAHMHLPKAHPTLERSIAWDPVALYQIAVGASFDIMALGLKQFIPRKLKENRDIPLPQLPWSTLTTQSRRIWRSPIARTFLPPLLHDANAFINDPIAGSNWPHLQKNMINALKAIETASNNSLVKTAQVLPEKVTTTAVRWAVGAPDIMTKLLLKLSKNPEVIGWLRALRLQLEQLNQNPIAMGEEDALYAEARNADQPSNKTAKLDVSSCAAAHDATVAAPPNRRSKPLNLSEWQVVRRTSPIPPSLPNQTDDKTQQKEDGWEEIEASPSLQYR